MIDKLLEGREHSAAVLGCDGLIGELNKQFVERMLLADMNMHISGLMSTCTFMTILVFTRKVKLRLNR